MGKEQSPHQDPSFQTEFASRKRPNVLRRIKNTVFVFIDPSKNYSYRHSDIKGFSRSDWVELGMFKTLEEAVEEDRHK